MVKNEGAPKHEVWETLFFFFNPHPRICLWILEREERSGGGGDGERERERNIDQLPPISALTGD